MSTVHDVFARFGKSRDVINIVSHFTGVSKAFLLLNPLHNVPQNIITKIELLQSGIPLQHLFGTAFFYRDEFLVNQNVLIPRPETQLLVDESINAIKKYNRRVNVLEIGVGSGAVVASVAKYCECDANFYGIDVSHAALRIARINAQKLGVNIQFLHMSIEKFLLTTHQKFDIIISNPPYIPACQILQLEKNVRYHDPMLALYGGIDGLYFYQLFAKHIAKIAKKNAHLILEIGFNQKKNIKNIFLNFGGDFKLKNVQKDGADFERILHFFKFF